MFDVTYELPKEEEEIPVEAKDFFVNEAVPFAINSAADANRRLWALRRIEERVAKIEIERDQVIYETTNFYQRKIDAQLRALEFMKAPLEAYVRHNGENLSLPNGKAIVKRTTLKDWAADDVLEAYSREKGIPLRVKTSPDKKAIEEYVELQDPSSQVLIKTEVQRFYTQFPKEDTE